MAGKKWDQLNKALDAISYEWLSHMHPDLLEAIESAIGEGVSPGEIKRHIASRTNRYELTLRCEQAARFAMRAIE